jgi:D-3-phosphoglycerate dehydrogenase / 2-oxoglutarate reductase
MHKVLVADQISQEGIDLMRQQIEVTYSPKITPAELLEQIDNYDALLVRSRTTVTSAVIKKGKKLKVIGRAGVGVDNIDVDAATEAGVVVLNSPEGNTASAAEHTLALMMALSRNVPAADRSLKSGEWERSKFTGSELFNKTLAVIGLGKVGTRVAQAAHSLGMKVIAYDPLVTSDRAAELHVQKVELEEIWSKADYITVHAPKTAETANMINAAVLAKMKKGVRIVNVARGGLIDEAALAKAIAEGHVAGAAFDVYEHEPPKDSPLLNLADKVVLTPHIGASTQEAQFNVAIDLSEQICEFLKTGVAKSPVNLPSMRPHVVKELGRFIWLAESLGTIASELAGGNIMQMEVVVRGTLAAKDSSPLVVAALRGMLFKRIQGVTYVNAHLVAKNKGIEVTTSKSDETGQFDQELTVSVVSDANRSSVTGTVLAHDEPLISRINAQPINLNPAPMMVFTVHRDQPGVVAQVAGVLAKHDINIATMSVARAAPRQDSVMVLGIDDQIDAETLGEISKLPGIRIARFVSLMPLPELHPVLAHSS